MFSYSTLLVTLTLALAVVANPVVTIRNAPVSLPMVKRINTTGTLDLVAHDKARIAGLRARASGSKIQSDSIVGSVPSTNQAVDYVVNVNIGSPPTTCTLSPNLFVDFVL